MEIVIVGKNLTTNHSFTKMFTGPLSLVLENGNWEFNMITWEMNANGPYTGNNRCGTASKVLAGGDVNINFTVDANGCIAMGLPAYKNSGNFHSFYLTGCTDFSGISSWSSTCDVNGPAKSYSVAVVPFDYSAVGNFAFRHDKLIPSLCASANMIKFPVQTSFPFPIVIRAHANSDCTPRGDDQIYLFSNGLDNGVRTQIETTGSVSKVFLRNLLPTANTVAAVPGVSPPNLIEDVESIISLTYADIDGELANDCAITGLSNAFISTPCTCNGVGECKVGITGNLNYNGTSTFLYKVETNSQWSGYSGANNLVFDPVNDPPVISFVGDVTYPSGTPTVGYFNIADPDGDVLNCASATINSNNLTVVPLANLGIPTGGAGPSCIFTVTPAAMGISILNLTILDPGGSAGTMSMFVQGT